MPRERVQHGKIWATETHPEEDGVLGAILVREYDPSEPPDLPEGATLSLRVDPSLEVAWSRDGENVQVCIDFPRERWIEAAKDLERHPDILSMAIFTESLSRYEINKMIKALRRARDAAYGKDE